MTLLLIHPSLLREYLHAKLLKKFRFVFTAVLISRGTYLVEHDFEAFLKRWSGAAFQFGTHTTSSSNYTVTSRVNWLSKNEFCYSKCCSEDRLPFMAHFPDDNNNSSKHLKLRSAWYVPLLISKVTINCQVLKCIFSPRRRWKVTYQSQHNAWHDADIMFFVCFFNDDHLRVLPLHCDAHSHP